LNVRENASGFGTNYVARASNTGAVDQAVTQGQAATNQDATATNQDATATNQNTGGGGAHNNLQPYIVVYMWRRTA
jgi:microcystin-dependent protein